MGAIFISYRREDSEGQAGRLFDDLVLKFGTESVFMDVADIEVGRDFRKAIDQSVSTCGVLLAIIGKHWLDAQNNEGKRRLDDPNDFVRLETASALKRDIPVVPVLVQGATMPRPEQLPDDLKELTYRNGVELTHVRWDSDVELLIKALRPYTGPSRQTVSEVQVEKSAPPVPSGGGEKDTTTTKRRRWLLPALGLVALLVIILIYALRPQPTLTTVPDVRGLALADAATTLQNSKLVPGQRRFRNDETKDPNVVLDQSPPAGARLREGSAVSLLVSQGGGQVQVPLLRGKSLDAARQELAALQLVVGEVQREPANSLAPGTVVRAFPRGGEKVNRGSKINLVVAENSQASAQDTCIQGYVWREASPSDHVCVTPAIRAQTARDNSMAYERRAGYGAYGADTCKQGFVWRDAFPGDHVCVDAATRTQAARDNQAAASRVQ